MSSTRMPEGATETEIERCKAAMSKPAPLEALRLIASGRVLIELSHDGRDVFLDSIDGMLVRDPENPGGKLGLAGSWPLYRAGMIDQFGVVTPAGRATLGNNRDERAAGRS